MNQSTVDKVNKASAKGQARKRNHDKTLQLEARKSNSKRSALYKQAINYLGKNTDKDRIRKRAKEALTSSVMQTRYKIIDGSVAQLVLPQRGFRLNKASRTTTATVASNTESQQGGEAPRGCK